MKIGLVLDDQLELTDGVQQYVKTLGNWLVEQGHSVKYLAGFANHSSKKRDDVIHLSRTAKMRFKKNNVRVPLPASGRRLRSMLAEEQFDILHVQMPFAPWSVGKVIMAAEATTGVVGTFHVVLDSSQIALATKALRPLYRNMLRRIDEACAVSEPAHDFMNHFYGLHGQIIPNAVAVARFKDAPSHKSIDSSKTTIVFLGRLVERKGAKYLLQAFAHLPQRKNYQLLLLGDGPDRASLQKLARELAIEEQVKFLGFVDEADKPSLLTGADLAVFPSTGGESFGIVLIEAMATKHTTVLAGNNPGYRTVMKSIPDALFDPQDIRQFSAVLQHALEDTNARQAMRQAQQKLVKKYDIETVGPQLLRVYDNALQRRKRVT